MASVWPIPPERRRIVIAALYDGHLHTGWSPDAAGTFSEVCQAALRRGLAGLTLTDHCDCGPYGCADWKHRLTGSVADALTCRAQYADRLWVGVGVELGQPLEDLPQSEQVLAAADYDVVLGSLHNLSTGEEFYCLRPAPHELSGLLARYFDELLDMVEWGRFDVLTHLTYPYRYLPGPVPPTREFAPALRRLFTRMAEQDIALELNTSGLRTGGFFVPGEYELALYRECGGTLVTLGSDSHHPGHIGGGLAEGAALLRRVGFSHYTIYQKRVALAVAL